MVAAILGIAVDVCTGRGSLGELFLFHKLHPVKEGGGSNGSIVSQLWERDRQNTPASLCHTTEEVWEKYALR